jgi:RNA recognition motif-containing protein
VLTPRLYVGNLSYDASESDLFDHFGKVAGVRNVEVVRDKGSSSKGFGFVEMQTLEGAQEAAKKLHDSEFMGRLLIVNGAKSMGERPERGPRRDDRGGPRAEIEESERAGRSEGDFDYDRGPRNPSFD